MNKSLISKICCWLDAIRLSSSCETQIILIEMVWINETHTYTHTHTHTHTHTPNTKHLERKITLERVGYYENKWYHPFLKNKPTNFTNLSIFMGKIWNPSFLKNLENSTTPKLRKEHCWLKNYFYTFFIRSTQFWLPKIRCFWFSAKVQPQVHQFCSKRKLFFFIKHFRRKNVFLAPNFLIFVSNRFSVLHIFMCN